MANSTHNYTTEKLAILSLTQLQNLRDNATKKGVSDLAGLCAVELDKRKSTKAKKTQGAENIDGNYVAGFHFVCSNHKGVTDNGDGTFWSGSWVVAERHVIESVKYEGYLSLHESKELSSYRQGRVVDYRRSPRKMVDRENEGIEFLVIKDEQSKNWIGSGSGEKGYLWMPLKVRNPG